MSRCFPGPLLRPSHNPQGPAHMDQGVTSSVTELPSGRCSSILRMCWTIHGLISNLSCLPSTPAPSKPLFHPTTFKKCLTIQTSASATGWFLQKLKWLQPAQKHIASENGLYLIVRALQWHSDCTASQSIKLCGNILSQV